MVVGQYDLVDDQLEKRKIAWQYRKRRKNEGKFLERLSGFSGLAQSKERSSPIQNFCKTSMV